MRKRTKLLFSALGLLIVLTAGIVFAVLWDMNKFIHTPANQAFGEEARYYYLTIDAGASFDKVTEAIFREHGISSVERFYLLGRWNRQTLNIKAGEFEFNTAWTPEQVLGQLVNGKVLLHRITIPEGLPWREIGKLLEKQGFARADDFAEYVNDAQMMHRFGIPFANAEGFLYPETYMLNKAAVPTPAHAKSAMHTMIQTFWAKTAALWDGLDKNSGTAALPEQNEVAVTASGQVIASFVPRYARQHPEVVKRLVIFASLVEKESAVAAERPKVAGVYANRLRIGMPLQCDPTVIYGLGEAYQGKLLRSHLLDVKNPYNTYKFYGLPPGPICSPGMDALKAAFFPEGNKYLYFVATGKGDGRHVFSSTLAEHNIAVKKYRDAIGN